jgi:predicted transcriptional regulator
MTTKHDRIIQYIMNLEAGAAISVRKVARELGVSQGTAYRAIKEAENREYVKTFPRMGTIRVEQDKKRGIERLTFAEAAAMVDGTVLGGNRGLNKTLVQICNWRYDTGCHGKILVFRQSAHCWKPGRGFSLGSGA